MRLIKYMFQDKVIYNTSEWTAILCPSHNFSRDIIGLATPLIHIYGACSFSQGSVLELFYQSSITYMYMYL